ncbi:hypothetical protein Bbelb_034540 [Branchiostoma belcheri]|nr:hypothetical protein Bbelb_034540 [Branchiostoma belcheri]
MAGIAVPSVELTGGVKFPMIGFGTWQVGITRKFPNKVHIPIKVRTPDLGLRPLIQAENWAEYLGVEVLLNLKFDTETKTTTKSYWDSEQERLWYFMRCQGNGTNTGATPVGAYRLDPPTGRASAPEVVGNAVRTALDAGYRHIDCAWNYFNEKEVGQAIRDKIAEGKVKREDVFVTTKLWCTFHRPEDVKRGFQESLKSLGLDYIDLFLIHGPPAFKPGPKWFPTDDSDFDDTDYVDTFKAMESLVDEGLCRAIGVSNFNPQQLERVLQNCRIKPAVNQVELHPYLVQQKLVDYCKSKDVVITAYSPLGSPGRDFAQPGEARVLEDPVVLDIAKNHGKTPAQVLLRYHLDRGIVVIPKSVTPSRIKENLQLQDPQGFPLP